MDLKRTLEELSRNEIQGGDLDVLLTQMLHQIGSTDPVLRDDLIYTTFGKLVTEDFLTKKQLTYLLNTCLDDEHLFYRIGERGTDSVFTRSFSVLVVALIIEKDREAGFLSENRFSAVREACFRYLREERDTRGYVEIKGWAHSIAHGADALTEVIRHALFDMEKMDECLEVIKECLFKEATTYVDDEDERLMFALEALMDRGLKEQHLSNWIELLSTELDDLFQQKGYSVEFFHTKGNVLRFMKSCYFRLIMKGEFLEARYMIEKVVERWTRKIYG
ncbi:DUF2785 domain-containing protein [Pseudalkalibacillus hwajinpoensis]|uniref:DUF2785 domain-containing protein n=1 Tax=Guptibacillus hwajinpoensis TaxID=208199 RepID=UPI001CD60BCF|nr:DUF2785 domain-containing protein [Pseudalkalibacillus hwajinpoensis]MCA0993809.1 DUF2785 domain-containing protein [Pseudalkalibacillus hwajinpoensis]